jgi:hypothetical protein
MAFIGPPVSVRTDECMILPCWFKSNSTNTSMISSGVPVCKSPTTFPIELMPPIPSYVETGYPYHVHQYDMNIETSIKGIEKQRVDNHRERQPETEKYMYDGIGGINSMGYHIDEHGMGNLFLRKY